jgi:hypothetical protein
MTISQRISALLEIAFDTQAVEFGKRNLILSNAAKAAGLKLFHSSHGRHCNIIHFEIYSGKKPLACFV